MTWKKYKPLEVSVHQYKATYLFLNDNFTTIIWAFHGLLLTLFNMILWTCMEIQTSRLLIFFFFSSTGTFESSYVLYSEFSLQARFWLVFNNRNDPKNTSDSIYHVSLRYAQLVWTEVVLFNFDFQSELSRIMRSKADGYGDWRLSVRGNNIFEH